MTCHLNSAPFLYFHHQHCKSQNIIFISSVCNPRAFYSKLKSHLFKTLTLTHLILFLPTLRLDYTPLTPNLPPLTLWELTCTSHGLSFAQPLWFDAALVKKLVRCAWLLSGALEVWRLRLRLRLLLAGPFRMACWLQQCLIHYVCCYAYTFIYRITYYINSLPSQHWNWTPVIARMGV